jgi:urease accessory protein
MPSMASAATGGPEFALMLLGDARLPSGGHTQSAGLEGALAAGMPEGDVPAYLRARLRTTATVDAGTAVAALTALRDPSREALGAVEQHWAARTPSHVQRNAAVTLGRGGLRLLRTLFPEEPATSALVGLGTPCRPLVLAGLACALRLDGRQLATVVCYDEVQSITAAALKLSPLDPVTTVRWALEVRPVVDEVVARVADVVHPEDIPAPAAPLMEQWAHAHARQARRLFSA